MCRRYVEVVKGPKSGSNGETERKMYNCSDDRTGSREVTCRKPIPVPLHPHEPEILLHENSAIRKIVGFVCDAE